MSLCYVLYVWSCAFIFVLRLSFFVFVVYCIFLSDHFVYVNPVILLVILNINVVLKPVKVFNPSSYQDISVVILFCAFRSTRSATVFASITLLLIIIKKINP